MRPEDICRNYTSAIIVRRWAATWLDFLLFGGMLFALVMILGENRVGWAAVTWLLLVSLYYPLLEGLTGKTFGKWLCRLKVVNAQGVTPGIGKATIRTLLRLVEVNPLLMGGVPAGIAVLVSQKHQRLGDIVADTYVLNSEDLLCLTMTPFPVPSSPMPTNHGYSVMPSSTPLAISPLPPTMSPYPGTPNHAGIPAYPVQRVPLPSAKAAAWALPGAGLATLAAIGLIWGGMYVKDREEQVRHPITMSCKQFLQMPPREGWYHLTGCDVDIPDAAYEILRFQADPSDSESGPSTSPTSDSVTPETGTISAVYVPVYASLESEQKKTSLLLFTNDDHVRRLVDEMRKLDSSDEQKVRAWVLAHSDELTGRKEITGTIQTEGDVTEATRDTIAKLRDNRLTSDYVIIKEGNKPMLDGPMAAMILGVCTGVIAVQFWLILLVSVLLRISQPSPDAN